MRRTTLVVVLGAMLFATFGVATGAPVDGGTGVAEASNSTDGVQENGTDLRSIEIGETAESELDEGDPVSEENRGRHEPVTFQGEAGQVVTITMWSDPGDTYLILRGPDGEEIARNDDDFDVDRPGSFNARIEGVELPTSGEYTIVATSFTEMDTFPYTLELEEGEPTDDGDEFTPTPGEDDQELEEDQNEPNDSCEGATQAAFGDSYEDLTIDSSSDEDYYAVELEAGQGVTASIDFSHSEGDIDLELTGPESTLPLDRSVSTTDGETVSATAEESGTHCIRVYGYSGATADYSLGIEEGATEGDSETETPGEDTSSGLDLRSIEIGETAAGSIDGDDPTSAENRGRHEPVTFQGEEGQLVTITMTSEPGDTYLILRGPDGEEIARNDDNFDVDGFLNSRIENVRLPASGEYTIVATSFTEMDTFDYELTLEEGSAGERAFEPDQFEPNENCEGATDAELGASYEDLNIGSSIDEDYYAVELEEGQGVTASIDFSHAEGDIDMSLEGPDSSFSLDSSISISDGETVSATADRSGTYCIRVYGYSGATAEYSLDIEEGATEDDVFGGDGGASSGADLRSISIGQTVEGSVDSEDPESDANRGTYEPVTFQGEVGQVVTIDMESEIGDTYLILQGPNGEVLTEDDDGGAGLNSRIDGFELPSNGEYTIIATSFWDGSTFDYTLSLQAGGSSGDGTLGQSETTDLTIPPVQATPGGTVEVTYELRNTADETRAFVLRSGLENLPNGWEVTDHGDDGGTWRSGDRTWLFQEIDAGGEVSPSATLQVPDDVSTGETFNFRASALTQEGSQGVRGTGTVTIEVRETTLAQAVDQNDNGQIDDLEILDAIEWWQNEEEVPGYGDTISDLQILDLIGMWQDEESVGGN